MNLNTLTTASNSGGAIRSTGPGARLNIADCQLDSNHATMGGGGAISNDAGSTAVLIRSVIVGNWADAGPGGGIWNKSAMTIVRCTVWENSGGTLDQPAAGIWNFGAITIMQSAVSYNTGGGIVNRGALSLVASSIVGNFAHSNGGGILSSRGSVIIINSTIDHNLNVAVSQFGGGGGLFFDGGTAAIYNCTITHNSDLWGGGIGIRGASVALYNSVVAENFGEIVAPDIGGAVKAARGNFIGVGDAALHGITNGTNGNHVGTPAQPFDPMLGELQNNCGPTLTRLPRIGSPLINAGLNALILQTTDQRGFRRIKFGVVDIGAVEFGATN